MQDRDRNALLLIMLTASFLRLWNIGTVPHWDYDEGTIMNISQNLLHGKFLLFNLTYPFIPHPPLFYMLTAAIMAVFGNDLTILRILAASCSIASVYALFELGREVYNVRFGLITSAVYAIYPNDIFFSRIGFANNLVALLFLVALLSIVKYRKEKKTQWLYYAASATGMAILTEYIAFALFLALALLVWTWDRRQLLVFSVISLAPVALFAAYMLSVMPGAFMTDFLHQFTRLRDYEGSNIDASSNFTGLTFLAIFALVLYRYKDFLKALYARFLWNFISLVHPGIGMRESLKIVSDTLFVSLLSLNAFIAATSFWNYSDGMFLNGLQDYYFIGIIGLFLLRKEQFRNVILICFTATFFAVLKVNRTDHMILLLYPFFSIGIASLLYWLYEYANSLTLSRAVTASVVLLLAAPFALIAASDASAFILRTGISYQDVPSTLAAADYINRNTNETDLVITDDNLMRFLKARTSDYVHCFIIDHKKVAYADADLGPERFVYNSSYRNARYFVMSKMTDKELSDLEKHYPDIGDVLEPVRKWPFHAVGNYTIYENPKL